MYHYQVSQSVSDVFLARRQAVHFFLFLSCSHNTPTATMPRVPPPPPPSRGGVGPPARLLNAPPPPPRDGASSPGPVSRSAPPPPIPERSPRYADGESLSLSLSLCLSVCLFVYLSASVCQFVCLPACLPALLFVPTSISIYPSEDLENRFQFKTRLPSPEMWRHGPKTYPSQNTQSRAARNSSMFLSPCLPSYSLYLCLSLPPSLPPSLHAMPCHFLLSCRSSFKPEWPSR